VEGRARVYPGADLARPADERRFMVTTHPAPTTAARVLVAEFVARFCLLVGFPVLAAARLAASLVLSPRPRRSRSASAERGFSARGGATQARVDRTQLRSLQATTSLASRQPLCRGRGARRESAGWRVPDHPPVERPTPGTRPRHEGSDASFLHNFFPSPRSAQGVALARAAGWTT
jgi:hypothetical protein